MEKSRIVRRTSGDVMCRILKAQRGAAKQIGKELKTNFAINKTENGRNTERGGSEGRKEESSVVR
jgi:hypothetical protein